MNYQIIARKYRPKNFSEVIGQDKIMTILQNALKKNRIGQAYLFSGPRGVGKTTTARILVKYLNCESEGTVIPCNQCQSCDEINRGISLDYLEIDGASNRGIDQIRALNEQLAFASPTGKHRVFVIDEVHMLTNEAFNALLKSLEEPPLKIIFILCTTESYRIPLTIRSRCQQLFFNNIGIELTEKHMEAILQKENIPFVPHSLWKIAQKAEGSIRDAENLLEKVIAFNDEKEITSSLVNQVLGDAPTDKKYLFLTHLNEEKLKFNLELVNQLNADGYNLSEFFYNLIDVFSNLVYFKSGVRDYRNLDISQEEVEKLKSCEKLFSLNEIFTLTDILFDFIRTLKNTTHRHTMIQYLLIKLHRYRNLISPGELKENILKLSRYTLPDSNLNSPQETTLIESNKPITFPSHSHRSDQETNRKDHSEQSKSQSYKPTDSSNKEKDLKEPHPPPDYTPNSLPEDHQDSPIKRTIKDSVNSNDILPKQDNSILKLKEKKLSSTQAISSQPTNPTSSWTHEDYQVLLQILKNNDLGLFRLAAAFPLQTVKGDSLFLENQNDMAPQRVADFQKQFEEYINQTDLRSHPRLKHLMDGRHLRVIIQENIVKTNLEKIKQIFPLDE